MLVTLQRPFGTISLTNGVVFSSFAATANEVYPQIVRHWTHPPWLKLLKDLWLTCIVFQTIAEYTYFCEGAL